MEFDLAESRTVLERTPAVLDTMLRGLPETWTQADEGPDTWSAFDVVGHLIHGDRTDWIARARIILDGNPAREFEPFDRFAQFEASRGKTLGSLLDDFARVRGESLRQLDSLHIRSDQLAMTARHPEFGPVTLRQLLATWTVHDLGHIAQISRVLAGQYKEAAGPWQAYLPILTR